MPNPSSLSECTDAQLLLAFISQKLLTSSFDHIAARRLGQFSSANNSVSRVVSRYLRDASSLRTSVSLWNC